MAGRTETQVEKTDSDIVRVGELSYEESLRVLNGQTSSQGLAPTTAAVQEKAQEFNQFGVNAGAALLGPLGIIAADAKDFTTYHATLGLFGQSRWNTTTDMDDSGFQYSDDWVATKWDKARYAIGIKELGIYSASYGVTSEFTSTPFSVPGPISKVALYADYTIPKAYKVQDPLKAWVEFYVTFDDGASFLQIAPVSNIPTVDGSGRRVPTIINVNSSLATAERLGNQGYFDSDRDVRSCRLRCRFIRPDKAGFEHTSPILKGYKLKFTVARSLG